MLLVAVSVLMAIISMFCTLGICFSFLWSLPLPSYISFLAVPCTLLIDHIQTDVTSLTARLRHVKWPSSRGSYPHLDQPTHIPWFKIPYALCWGAGLRIKWSSSVFSKLGIPAGCLSLCLVCLPRVCNACMYPHPCSFSLHASLSRSIWVFWACTKRTIMTTMCYVCISIAFNPQTDT